MRSQGFPLIDLLVSIAFIGIVVAPLPLAIEAARQGQYMCNLKYVGIAMYNSYAAAGGFPQGRSRRTVDKYGLCFAAYARLMPSTEHPGVYVVINSNLNRNNAPTASSARESSREPETSTAIGTMMKIPHCPSELAPTTNAIRTAYNDAMYTWTNGSVSARDPRGIPVNVVYLENESVGAQDIIDETAMRICIGETISSCRPRGLGRRQPHEQVRPGTWRRRRGGRARAGQVPRRLQRPRAQAEHSGGVN
jgi:hypothetical protein